MIILNKSHILMGRVAQPSSSEDTCDTGVSWAHLRPSAVGRPEVCVTATQHGAFTEKGV